jgi:hypothetical protein
LSTVGKKTAVKVYYAKKTLQLLDILRQPVFNFGGVVGRGGSVAETV